MFFYNILLNLLALPIILALLLLSLVHKRLKKNILQRIGFYQIRKFRKRPVWFHCSSLGEFNAIKNMLLELKKSYGEVFVTLLTDTGREAASRFLGRSRTAFLPLDFNFLLKPFIKQLNPVLLVIEETEIWPNLICQAHKAHVPILYTNCIISRKSFLFYQGIGFIFKKVLRYIHLFFIQNESTGKNLLSLGVKQEQIKYAGNIKFDVTLPPVRNLDRLRNKLLLRGKPVLIAGSTREGEEKVMLVVFRKLKEHHKNLKLILAPRHLSRLKEVEELVRKENFIPAFFSRVTGPYDVLLVDKMGVLISMYALSDVCMIGGTMVPVGGHNPLEAVFFKKPIVSGPSIGKNKEGFLKIAQNKGGFIVDSEEELYQKLLLLFNDKGRRVRMGRNAFKVIQENQGASRKIVRFILKHYLLSRALEKPS